MKYSKNIGIFSLLMSAGLVWLLVGCDTRNNHEANVRPVVFSHLQGTSWARECARQHPEILWLADSQVHATQEGRADASQAYSVQLFGRQFSEFDRTLMTLHCLKLILDGSSQAYATFTAGQPQDARLTQESFRELHHQGQALLHSEWGGLSARQIAQTMTTALVLGDMGKSAQARKAFKPYGAGAPDHDDFYGEALPVLEKRPWLCPSFAALPPAGRKLLAKVGNLAHFGHITHLEGDCGMFTRLKESGLPGSDPTALAFELFVHTCDVAGALGHLNRESSLAYLETTHRAMRAMTDAVRTLANPGATERDAYDSYLKIRAGWLGQDPAQAEGRVLARLGAMLRLSTPEEGTILIHAMRGLDSPMRTRINEQLDVQRMTRSCRTPTYMPAVLVNLANNPQLGKSQGERLAKAITLGLPLIVNVLEEYKLNINAGVMDPDIPLNFNAVAGVAKSAPHKLNNPFSIAKDGRVQIVL